MTIWKDPLNRWECADTEDFTKWWTIPRMLEIPLLTYVIRLKDTYHAQHIEYNPNADVLIFDFCSYTDAEYFRKSIHNACLKKGINL